MKRFGLIGKSLSHSFSRAYFEEKFRTSRIDARYENFELNSIEEVQTVFKIPELVGLNVTVPYKEAILPYLDDIDTTADLVGAVNTISLKEGRTKGFNTDVIGFENSLKPFLEHGMERALILGTGGAAKAVAFVLRKIGLEVLFVSRAPSGENQIDYETCNANAVKWHRLIVNTTPLGTHPNMEQKSPIAYEGLTEKHLLYDLVYNPEETAFLKEGKLRGAKTINGLSMLKIQAEKSWEIWNSET
jgi:shikimate dehydrogenase